VKRLRDMTSTEQQVLMRDMKDVLARVDPADHVDALFAMMVVTWKLAVMTVEQKTSLRAMLLKKLEDAKWPQ
jgi:hypothetical protein